MTPDDPNVSIADGSSLRVSVVIPARDAAPHLADAVASALAQAPVDEVVVAVGPSGDDTEAIAQRLAAADPRVAVVASPSGTTPDGLNAAIAASSGQVIVRLDAHAQLPPGYVERAVATLERTDAANVGGRQVPVGASGFARGVAAAMRSRAGSGGAIYRSGGPEGPADTVYLGVFRRAAVQDVGGFASQMLRNQDAELNARLRASGYVVWFDPELEVAYRPRDSVRALARQYFQYGRWRRATMRRHPGQLKLRQLAAPAIVIVLVGSLGVGGLLADLRVPAVVVVGYLAAVSVAAVAAADDLRTAPPAAVALVVMHVAWGIGFLVGAPAGAAARGTVTRDDVVEGRPGRV